MTKPTPLPLGEPLNLPSTYEYTGSILGVAVCIRTSKPMSFKAHDYEFMGMLAEGMERIVDAFGADNIPVERIVIEVKP